MAERYEVCIASTAPDNQGEAVPKSELERLLRDMPDPTYLGAEHDIGAAGQAYVTGLRMHFCETSEHWQIRAELVVPDGVEFEFKAFSWSSVEPSFSNHPEPILAAFIPWPEYNDDDAMRQIGATDLPLTVGKWRKKSGIEDNAVLIACMLVLIEPVWLHLYSSVISAKIHALCRSLQRTFPKLRPAYVYTASTVSGHEYQIRISHAKAPEYRAELHRKAIQAVKRAVKAPSHTAGPSACSDDLLRGAPSIRNHVN